MTEKDRAIAGLRALFAFGVPGGRTKVQRAIGRYLDGDDTALDAMPTIRGIIDKGVSLLRDIPHPQAR